MIVQYNLPIGERVSVCIVLPKNIITVIFKDRLYPGLLVKDRYKIQNI